MTQLILQPLEEKWRIIQRIQIATQIKGHNILNMNQISETEGRRHETCVMLYRPSPVESCCASTIFLKHSLALHLVGSRADCVPQDAVLLLQSSDLALQLLPHLLELNIKKQTADKGIQSLCSL